MTCREPLVASPDALGLKREKIGHATPEAAGGEGYERLLALRHTGGYGRMHDHQQLSRRHLRTHADRELSAYISSRQWQTHCCLERLPGGILDLVDQRGAGRGV